MLRIAYVFCPLSATNRIISRTSFKAKFRLKFRFKKDVDRLFWSSVGITL